MYSVGDCKCYIVFLLYWQQSKTGKYGRVDAWTWILFGTLLEEEILFLLSFR